MIAKETAKARASADWAECAFEALDIAAVAFDETLQLRAANFAWRLRFESGVVSPGAPAMEVLKALCDRDSPERLEGYTPEDLIGLLRSYVRDYEIPRPLGDALLLSSTALPDGGTVLTIRNPDRGRIAEAKALTLLKDSLETLGLGLVLWDAGLVVRAVNAAWSEHVMRVKPGETVSEMSRRLAASGIVPARRGLTAAETVAEIVLEGHHHPRRWEAIHHDGRIVRVSTFPTQSGGVLCVAADVTEARPTEERARVLFSDAINSIAAGIILLDGNLETLLYNTSLIEMMFDRENPPPLGLPISETIKITVGLGMTMVPEGISTAKFLDGLKDAIIACRDDIRVELSEGRFIEGSAYPTAMGGYVVVLQEVTERRAAERSAIEAEELLRTIVEASPTTFLVTRLDDGKIIYAPPLSRERFGKTANSRSFFDPEDRTRYIEALSETGILTDYPVRFRRADGSIMDGLTSARITEFRGEKLIVSSTRDITERLAMQAELVRQRELAHQNEKLSALGGLLAGVAHELNNPLSIVVANAMMLEEDVRDPALRRRIERIATAAKRSGRIVKSFLAMARNRPTRMERAQMSELVELALEVAGYGLQAAGADIVCRLDPADPAVNVDPDHIVQVLSNLIVNAEQAMRGMGAAARLEIESQARGKTVELVLRDNGPGVPDELRNRIFEPYFTTKDPGEGTGVGLAFSHRIVTAHGGTLTLDPSTGRGAQFRMVLPIAGMAAMPATEDKAEAPRMEGRILLLDDEPEVVETVTDVLNRAGYEVVGVTSAREALRACASMHFDALLSDVRMPQMDGIAFYRELQKQAPAMAGRLAFMTGDAIGEGGGQRVRASGRPFVEKPVEPAEIVRLVATIIEEAGDGQ